LLLLWFLSGVYATPPHTNRMEKGYSWEGQALPNPPVGGGVGKPGFSTPLLQETMFTSGTMRLAPHTATG